MVTRNSVSETQNRLTKLISKHDSIIEQMGKERGIIAKKYEQITEEYGRTVLSLLATRLLLNVFLNKDPSTLHDIDCDNGCEFCKLLEDIEEKIKKVEYGRSST